jgi:hypothetical protein
MRKRLQPSAPPEQHEPTSGAGEAIQRKKGWMAEMGKRITDAAFCSYILQQLGTKARENVKIFLQ